MTSPETKGGTMLNAVLGILPSYNPVIFGVLVGVSAYVTFRRRS